MLSTACHPNDPLTQLGNMLLEGAAGEPAGGNNLGRDAKKSLATGFAIAANNSVEPSLVNNGVVGYNWNCQ